MPVILYTLFAASLLPILLAWLGGYCRARQLGRFDNHYPRLQQSQLTGFGARVQGAQANAWESLAIYTCVCFIAHASGLALDSLDGVALLFLALRIGHAICYLANLAWLRSLVYAAGMGCCLYIVYLAARGSL